jgi:hypothetical protein
VPSNNTGVSELRARVELSVVRPNRVGVPKLACVLAVISIGAMSALCGCGRGSASAHDNSLPPGVMTPPQACKQVIEKAPKRFFVGTKRVHLVLTTYAKGEPLESQGDISSGMPPHALVWVVEVHARAIHWNHSVPAGYQPPARPYTDFSVVMNARTGRVSDQGECRCWPLPLSKAGTVVSLPPRC